MAFRKITEGDMLGKGNVGRPDTPGVSTAEMQRIMDELPREVLAPAFNELASWGPKRRPPTSAPRRPRG